MGTTAPLRGPRREPDQVAPAFPRRFLGIGQGGQMAYAVAATAAGIALAVTTVGPLGTSGRALVVSILLGVNCVLLATRTLFSIRISDFGRTLLLWAGVAASVALLALARADVATVFGFFVAGQAGFSLPPSRSIPIAAACSIAHAGVLLLGWGGADRWTSWPSGAATGLAVLAGIFIRSRQQLLRTAIAAAESAERATQAETRAAILAERGRIARDVHDVLAHSLAGVGMQLALANALLDRGELVRARQLTGQAQDSVRGSLVEAQRTVQTLRADSLPLVDTLGTMARSGVVEADFDVHGTVRDLDDRISYAIIRITQESLTNGYKHAPGADIRIALAFLDECVDLLVVNEPSTATSSAPLGSGLGLVGMRERAADIGAMLTAGPTVTAAGPAGWQVHLRVPT